MYTKQAELKQFLTDLEIQKSLHEVQKSPKPTDALLNKKHRVTYPKGRLLQSN